MKIAIFGSSGQARDAADVCDAAGCSPVLFIDRAEGLDARFGITVMAESRASQLAAEGYYFLIGVGSNRLRKKIWSAHPDLPYVNVVHPTVTFGRNSRQSLDATFGNVLSAGVRITNNVEFGNFGIYNINCTVSHDCRMGDFVNICPGANVTGCVHVDEGGYVGAGAVVIQGRSCRDMMTVGAYATIGAGAVVTRDVAAGAVVKGVPAK